MKLLIAEEGLIGRNGHWFEYIKTITQEFRKSGDVVKIAANKDAKKDILEELDADAVFPESVWGQSRSQSSILARFMQLWNHNKKLYKSIDQYVEAQGSFDVLFVPTILIDHILGWRKFAKKHAGKRVKRIVLFFVNGQGTYAGPNTPIHFSKSLSKQLFRRALKSLAEEVMDGSVCLACETREMAREYEQFCGLPFGYIPHPVEEVPLDEPSKIKDFITVGNFGFPRYEKGSDLLQVAIEKYINDHPDAKVKFVLQWTNDFTLSDGTVVSMHPKLINSDKVHFIQKSLISEAYRSWLTKIDIMLLPYRLKSYYARVSRVAIEAAINAIPIVFTLNSWNESLVTEGHGAGLGFESENVDDLYRSIEKAIDEIETLKSQAEKRKELASDHHSAKTFRMLLRKITGARVFE